MELSHVNDLFTEARLNAALGERPFQFFPSIGSTNDIARGWSGEGAPNGTLVITEEQTAGRGRFGRTWSAPPGTALLMSVILRPQATWRLNQAATHLTRLTMVGAVAVTDGLRSLPSLPLDWISIKWPNDVHLGGRKVAGVLPEAVWEGDNLRAIILGIGLNVRIDFSGTPLAVQATSIERVTGTVVDRLDFLTRLLARIDHWSQRLMDEALLTAWRSELATIGQRVTVQNLTGGQDEALSGIADDVDDDGALLVRTDDGIIHRVTAGEVTLRDPKTST